MAITILLVRVEAPEVGKEDCSYLDLEHIRTTNSLLQHVQQMAWDLLPGASQIQATYLDDEGDKCTLTEQTAKDAITFATPFPGESDTSTLTVTVRGEWAQPAEIQIQMQDEPAPMPFASAPQEGSFVDNISAEQEEQAESDKGTAENESDISNQEVENNVSDQEMKCEAAEPQPSHLLPDQVEESAPAAPVIRRVFQRDSAKPPVTENVAEEAAQDPGSELQCLKKRVVAAGQDLADLRRESYDLKLLAKEVEEQAEEDVKRHVEESAKYMQEADKAKHEVAEAQMAREQAHEVAEGLLQTLVEEQSARKEAQKLAHSLQQSLEEEQRMRQELEDTKQQIEALAGATLAEEQTARKDTEDAQEHAQYLADALQQSLAEEKSARSDLQEAHQQLQALEKELKQQLAEEQDARREVEEAKQHLDMRLDELQQCMTEETAARTDAESDKQQMEVFVDGLQQCMNEERSARSVVESAKQQMQVLVDELQQCMGEEHNARREAQESHQQMEEIADELQRSLAEEQQTRKDVEEVNQQMKVLVDELQQSLAEEQRARKEAEDAKQQTETCADGLQQSLNDMAECLQERAAQTLADAEAAKVEAVTAAAEAQNTHKKEMQQKDRDMSRAHEMARQQIELLRNELLNAKEHAAKAEKFALEVQKSKDAMPRYSASVQMIEDCPLTLGIEAEEDVAARGDATKEYADLVSSCGASQAFRIGRVRLPASFSEVAPACARVAVKNDGAVRWPQTTVIVNVEGDNMGMQVKELGVLEPGEVREIEMDLEVQSRNDLTGQSQKRVYRPRHAMPQLAPRFVAGEARPESRSLWAIVDADTGARLGPLLVFEAVWDLP